MRLIDGKLLADVILGEIFERGQASGLWEQQVEIGALTYADIEFANGYDKALDEVYRKINDMPTVKNTIPVEWIRKWHGIDDIKDCDLREYVKCTMLYMIKDWKSENEVD